MSACLLNVVELEVSGDDARVLVRGVTFSLARSERIAIAGPNGAGKSSLVKAIAGIRPYSKGSARVLDDKEVKSLEPQQLAQVVSYVPQRVEQLPNFSVEEFLVLSSSRHSCESVLATAYRLVPSLLQSRLPDLSGGELQRVLLAGAIAQGALLIVLDEPTASLDPKGRREVEQALRRDGYGADLSCILVTHDISLAVRTCDRMLVMKDGKIVWSGGVTELGLLPALEVAYGCDFSRMTPDDGTETFIVPR